MKKREHDEEVPIGSLWFMQLDPSATDFRILLLNIVKNAQLKLMLDSGSCSIALSDIHTLNLIVKYYNYRRLA